MSENLLRHETSPYLLQHQGNPVHWRAWGAEALEEARTAGKPILLSIGYAACHWCHVMAHESFEDDEVAAVMNRHFVNIKVDREERPDIDSIYMTALQLLGEHGGWPLTMFLTPKAEPFWGGTYFPKQPGFGRPGFIQVLEEVARVFAASPERIEQNRAALLERLAATRPSAGEPLDTAFLDAAFLDALADPLLQVADFTHGGMMGAPKFPQTAYLELLWRLYERTGNARCRAAALTALDRMCMGGIYDHLGGGFSRYSVDALWLVPHFEKMLYDNALLLDFLSIAWRATGSPLYAIRIEETVGWLAREMRTPCGAFAASLDADSEGEEGRFYVWQDTELREILDPEDYDFFAAAYGVRPDGNWEGKTILNRLHDTALKSPEEERRLSKLRARLLELREKRVRPGLDDKVLADWNGLVIHALADTGFALSRPDWIDMAQTAFDFVAESMSEGHRLWHSHRNGGLRGKGLLLDYAAMTRAALALYERAGRADCLVRARDWTQTLESHFRHPSGGYYMAPDDADDLIVRPFFAIDDAIPNGNALVADNLVRLWHLTGEPRYRDRAEALFTAFAADIRRAALGHCAFLNAFDLADRAAQAVLVSGGEGDGTVLAGILRAASPTTVISSLIEDGANMPAGHPAHGKKAVDGKSTAFVCREGRCSLPLTDPGEFEAALRPAAPASR